MASSCSNSSFSCSAPASLRRSCGVWASEEKEEGDGGVRGGVVALQGSPEANGRGRRYSARICYAST